MSTNNRKCVICGKEYKFCYSCNSTNQPTWKADFCDENCREIYRVCVEFDSGSLSKADALARLNKCNLADFSKFTDSTKSIIRRIQKVDQKPIPAKQFKRKK